MDRWPKEIGNDYRGGVFHSDDMDGRADHDMVMVYLRRIGIVPVFVDSDHRPASESRTSALVSVWSSQ